MLIDEEWLDHALVGALPWPALLWVWDQCALTGWGALAEMAADCLWLLRRDIKRLDEVRRSTYTHTRERNHNAAGCCGERSVGSTRVVGRFDTGANARAFTLRLPK